MSKLTIVQAVVFFVVAAVGVIVGLTTHQGAFLFLGVGIAACTVVSLIDKAATSRDNGGFMFLTGDAATYVNMALFAVAMVFMVLSGTGTIRI